MTLKQLAIVALIIAYGFWPARQAAAADGLPVTDVEQAFASIEGEYRHNETGVRLAAYEDLPVGQPPSSSWTITPPTNTPSPAHVVPPAPAPSAPTHSTIVAGSTPYLHTNVAPRKTSVWFAGVEMAALESELGHIEFGSWPDETGPGLRVYFGHENAASLGTRARLWGSVFDVSPPAGDVELTATAVDIDLYKRIVVDNTELVVGLGPSGRFLEFELADGSFSRFKGVGPSAFLETYIPLAGFPRTEIGFVGRGRYTIVNGEWTDTTGTVIAPTDNDSMSVTEIAWGLEMRRRFGRHNNRYWYLGVLREYQRWDSQWLGANSATSIALSGWNLNTGWVW